MAIQKDHGDVFSDCYLHTNQVIYNIKGFFQSFINIYEATQANIQGLQGEVAEDEMLPPINIVGPIMWWNTFLIELSDQLVACDYKMWVKQINFRT